MEQELLEHIIKTEVLSNDIKNVITGVIKFKSRAILLLKIILVIHISTTCAILYFYPEILSITNILGITSVLINIGINLSLFVSIRLREKNLAKLKIQFH